MRPSSIDDLRELLNAERAKHGRSRVGEKALGVLADMLDRSGSAAVESISALAASNGVNPSTLTRLGKKLGLSGFGELQDIFRRHVAQTQPFYSTRVQEQVAEPADIVSPEDLMRRHAQSECQKVISAVEKIDVKTVERAVDLLVSARHVYVLALRATYAFSFFFGTYLGTLRENVTVLGGPGHTLTSDLARITRDDLLVAISFRPYTRAVIAAVDVMKENAIPIVALTDTSSALQVTDEQGVAVVIDKPFYFDSATSHFFLVQTILLAAVRRLGPAAVEMAKRRERLDQALNVEIRWAPSPETHAAGLRGIV